MWLVSVRGVCSLVCAFLSAVCEADPGTPPYSVNGTLGQSVFLPVVIPPGSKYDEVIWKRTARITRYIKGSVDYYGTEEDKQRMKLHPENFSLQISDLQREDAGVYQLTVTTDSGVEMPGSVRLDVYEAVSGTTITIQKTKGNCNITLTCSVTSGDRINFRWWRRQEAVGNDSTQPLSEYGEGFLSEYGEELSLYFAGEPEPEDSVYKCEARNPVSEGTAEIRLGAECNVIATAEPSCNCRCVLRATVCGIVLAILLSVTVVTHMISGTSNCGVSSVNS